MSKVLYENIALFNTSVILEAKISAYTVAVYNLGIAERKFTFKNT